MKGLGLGMWFSMGVGRLTLTPRGHVTVSGDIFSCHHLVERGTNGIKWIEAKDTAEDPTMYRTFFTTKNCLAVAQFFVCSNLNFTSLLEDFFPAWAHVPPDQNHAPFLFYSTVVSFVPSCTYLAFSKLLVFSFSVFLECLSASSSYIYNIS